MGKDFVVKLTAVLLCVFMLSGFVRVDAFATEADNPYRLVDLYCSQTAKDALGYEQLQTLVDIIVTSIEPQAVNLLVERFPCFKEAAENNELGREIGLYIYYTEGDEDGIDEHLEVAPGSYAYVNGYSVYENGKTAFKYMIGIDAESCYVVPTCQVVYDILTYDNSGRPEGVSDETDTGIGHSVIRGLG
jgi:hypothetical protein